MTLNISFDDWVLKWNIFIPNGFVECKSKDHKPFGKTKSQKPCLRSLNFDSKFSFLFLMSFQRTFITNRIKFDIFFDFNKIFYGKQIACLSTFLTISNIWGSCSERFNTKKALKRVLWMETTLLWKLPQSLWNLRKKYRKTFIEIVQMTWHHFSC